VEKKKLKCTKNAQTNLENVCLCCLLFENWSRGLSWRPLWGIRGGCWGLWRHQDPLQEDSGKIEKQTPKSPQPVLPAIKRMSLNKIIAFFMAARTGRGLPGALGTFLNSWFVWILDPAKISLESLLETYWIYRGHKSRKHWRLFRRPQKMSRPQKKSTS